VPQTGTGFTKCSRQNIPNHTKVNKKPEINSSSRKIKGGIETAKANIQSSTRRCPIKGTCPCL
jgi:hypothetical protein